jgi:hypothetical protein
MNEQATDQQSRVKKEGREAQRNFTLMTMRAFVPLPLPRSPRWKWVGAIKRGRTTRAAPAQIHGFTLSLAGWVEPRWRRRDGLIIRNAQGRGVKEQKRGSIRHTCKGCSKKKGGGGAAITTRFFGRDAVWAGGYRWPAR